MVPKNCKIKNTCVYKFRCLTNPPFEGACCLVALELMKKAHPMSWDWEKEFKKEVAGNWE